MLGIKDIATYLPSGRITSAELSEKFGFEMEFLNEKVGVETRVISAPDESTGDMGVQAVNRLFEQNPELSRGDIEFLMVCTQTPDHPIPHTSAQMQDTLGLGQIPTFDISLACSGYLYGLNVCTSFMAANGFKTGILVNAESYSKIIGDGDRGTMPIFGDGAAATLVTADPICRAKEYTFGSDGAGASALIIEKGGSRQPLKPGDDPSNLYMNGRGIYEFGMKTVSRDITRCLEVNGYTADDIDHFVLHQASRFMITSLTKRLRLPEEKVFIGMRHIGNTVSASIPIALNQLREQTDLSGKRVFIAGFGGGLSWGSTVLKFS